MHGKGDREKRKLRKRDRNRRKKERLKKGTNKEEVQLKEKWEGSN